MDELEISKIFGAGCAALLAFVGLGQLGSAVVSVDQLKEPAFIVEIAEEDTGETEVVEAKPIGQLMAMAEMDHGAKVFKKCTACHKIADGAAHGVGPNLWAVVGREIAAMDGYSYSDALAGKGGEWDFAALNGFLEAPKDWAPGTKMGFAGLSKEKDRASVIAWMNEQSADPVPMPAVEEESAEADVEEQEAVEVAAVTEADAAETEAPEAEVAEVTEPEAVEAEAEAAEAEVTEAAEAEAEPAKVAEASEEADAPVEKAEEVQEEKAAEPVETAEADTAAEETAQEEAKAEPATEEAKAAEPAAEEAKEEVAAAPEAVEEKAADEDVKVAMADTGDAAAAPAAASGFMALADMKRGKKVFNKCRACHKVKADKHGVGPSLHGVVGRDIAAIDGFKYSDALKGKDGKWDVEALNAFLEKPKEWAPGTKMAFAGLRKEEDRASIIAWLNEQSDAPLDLGQ